MNWRVIWRMPGMLLVAEARSSCRCLPDIGGIIIYVDTDVQDSLPVAATQVAEH